MRYRVLLLLVNKINSKQQKTAVICIFVEKSHLDIIYFISNFIIKMKSWRHGVMGLRVVMYYQYLYRIRAETSME